MFVFCVCKIWRKILQEKNLYRNEIILQHYIYIRYKWCEHFNEIQFIVTVSMSQLIWTKCELRPGITSSVQEKKNNVFSRVNACQRKKKFLLTLKIVLDEIFLILTVPFFLSLALAIQWCTNAEYHCDVRVSAKLKADSICHRRDCLESTSLMKSTARDSN